MALIQVNDSLISTLGELRHKAIQRPIRAEPGWWSQTTLLPPLKYPAVTFPTFQNLTFSVNRESRVLRVATGRFIPTSDAEQSNRDKVSIFQSVGKVLRDHLVPHQSLPTSTVNLLTPSGLSQCHHRAIGIVEILDWPAATEKRGGASDTSRRPQEADLPSCPEPTDPELLLLSGGRNPDPGAPGIAPCTLR